MRYRLKISEAHFAELERLVLADLPKEAAAFALAGSARHAATTDVIVRRPIAIPKEHFTVQHELHLELSTAAVNGLIALCEKNKLGAVLCHSHPENIPYSGSDDHGERRVFETLRQFISPDAPTASLLFYPGGVRGRVWFPGSRAPIPISEILVTGRYVRRIPSEPSVRLHVEARELTDLEIFDRQVRAFGKEGQALIMRTKVGVIGVGGTGSPTAEQLVRLGTGDLVLIDPDAFEPSNRTRCTARLPLHRASGGGGSEGVSTERFIWSPTT